MPNRKPNANVTKKKRGFAAIFIEETIDAITSPSNKTTINLSKR
jgi:hypothetical protein